MRLGHLHIQGLIPYSHSLQLQSAILDRQFRHKDRLRSPARAVLNNAAIEYGESRGQRSNNPHAYQAQQTTVDSDTILRPAEANDRSVASRHNVDATTEHIHATNIGHHQSRNPPPTSGYGSHTTLIPLKAHRGFSSKNRQYDHTTPPDPVLLTFSTPPTYTVGRRHLLTNPISPEQQSFLSANGLATFHASPRGGLLTYHGPGQMTGYVIADIRRHGITARCWVKLLEQSVMRTCSAWGVRTGTTNDPGVWVLDNVNEPGHATVHDESQEMGSKREPSASDRKICAIGVQVSRGITSHGVGLNVRDAPLPLVTSSHTQMEDGDYTFSPAQLSSPSYYSLSRGYLSWGFSRIVACGLEGKSVSWLTREIVPSHSADGISHSHLVTQNPSQPTEEAVAKVLAREIMVGLNTMKGADKEVVDGTYEIEESDVLG